MRRYYISTFTGDGLTEKTQFRPVLADFASVWGIIDLRPDPTKADGYCIAFADTAYPLVVPGSQLIAESVLDNITSSRSLLNSLLGVEVNKTILNEYLADLLINTRSTSICKPIQPMLDGKYRLFLGGQIWGDPMPTYTHHTITDNFNRATLGSDWTIVSGTWATYNSAEVEVSGAYNWIRLLRYDASELSSDNHYAQVDFTYTGHTARFLSVAVRVHDSDATCYTCMAREYDGMRRIEKVVSGTGTTLASDSGGSALPHTFKLEADGSSLTFYEDEVVALSTTDTSITGNTHVGLRGCPNPGYPRGDNFEASELVSITPKTSSDSGTGADAKSTGQPLVQCLRSETGAGTDAEAGYPSVAIVRGEEGSGVESVLMRLLAASETGNGTDARAGYPAVFLARAEAAAGVESLFARILAVAESGAGVESLAGSNPLAGLLTSDGGVGLDALIALVQSFAIVSNDAGIGSDALISFLGLRTVIDTGSGMDILISRLLGRAETGSGVDISSLLASIAGVGETGSAIESAHSLPVIVSVDAGFGSELIFLLKDIIDGDGGKAVEMLKYLITTAGPSTDMRLHLRSGQAGRAGEDRQAYRRHGQVRLPSKEVDL